MKDHPQAATLVPPHHSLVTVRRPLPFPVFRLYVTERSPVHSTVLTSRPSRQMTYMNDLHMMNLCIDRYMYLRMCHDGTCFLLPLLPLLLLLRLRLVNTDISPLLPPATSV